MKNFMFFLMVCLVVAMSAVSYADDNKDSTIYEFEDDLVEGLTFVPKGENIKTIKKPTTRSLIKIRKQFVDRMFKSAENI